MDREIDRQNRTTLERLRTMAGHLSDEDLVRPIDPSWSAAALYAHTAFWDRFAHARWLHAEKVGEELPISIDDGAMEMVNQAALAQWATIPPRTAVKQCLEAADRSIA